MHASYSDYYWWEAGLTALFQFSVAYCGMIALALAARLSRCQMRAGMITDNDNMYISSTAAVCDSRMLATQMSTTVLVWLLLTGTSKW